MWVWRTQKCNRFLGIINALGVTARQTTRFHAPRIRPREEIWEISKLSKAMVPPLHQSNVYIRSRAVGKENPKIQSLSRCNKRTGCYRTANNPLSCTAYRAERGYLRNFEAVESNGTAFAPKQSSYQKVDVGMENPKIQSLFGAISALGVTAGK